MTPDARFIGICHHNLGIDPAVSAPNQLAAALIFRLIGMAHPTESSLRSLAQEPAEVDGPITLQQVIQGAERTEGVRLGALLASLATEEEAVGALAEILRTASGGR